MWTVSEHLTRERTFILDHRGINCWEEWRCLSFGRETSTNNNQGFQALYSFVQRNGFYRRF